MSQAEAAGDRREAEEGAATPDSSRLPPSAFSPADLAPGDSRSAGLDLSALRFDRIRALDDPLFESAYAALWEEFGPRHEMETRATLAGRFALAPAMRYELILAREAATGAIAAVRDHTAIPGLRGIIVHLSHNLVSLAHRRTGLAGWMRALPLVLAREAGGPAAPVTLVGEMEYDDPADPARALRLRAYEKAGFLKIDPRSVDYHQPDFRSPGEIDATGGPRPLPFQLLVRRVGREHERAITGAEVRDLVAALHRLYAAQFRPADMRHPALDPARLPPPDAVIVLIAPSA